jgi:hypothetical protein
MILLLISNRFNSLTIIKIKLCNTSTIYSSSHYLMLRAVNYLQSSELVLAMLIKSTLQNFYVAHIRNVQKLYE